jgi:chemotaxis protein CheD
MDSHTFIEVETGRVCLGGPNEVLRASALGSCIAVVLHDPARHRGALAHVMLPGAAPASATEPNRYAVNAIREAIRLLETEPPQLTAWLVGGANVLRDPEGEPLCQQIRDSVVKSMTQTGVTVRGRSLGGTKRRSVLLVVETGEVYYSVGDGPEKPFRAEITEEHKL